MTQDPFEKAPEFLAAFKRILRNGFFESLNFQISSSDGKIASCSITAVGYVPKDQKYNAAGCSALVDPEDLVQRIRTIAASEQMQTFSVEVKTEDWDLWDDKGENVIGSKGTKTKLFLHTAFKH